MKAINYLFRGIVTTFEELSKGKYLKYFIPGVILALIYVYLEWKFGGREGLDWSSRYSVIDWILGGFNAISRYVLQISGVIADQLYIFAVLIILSPFNAALGEKFDKNLSGYEPESGIIRYINDIIRMIFITIITVILELVFTGLYKLLSWTLGISDEIDHYVYFAIGAFFFGFAVYDYALERYGKGVFTSLGFAFKRPLGMILLGGVFLAIYAIPYAGIPLATTICVMITTVSYLYYTGVLPRKNDLKAKEHE